MEILNEVPASVNPVPASYTCEVVKIANVISDVPNMIVPAGALTINETPSLTMPPVVKKKSFILNCVVLSGPYSSVSVERIIAVVFA